METIEFNAADTAPLDNGSQDVVETSPVVEATDTPTEQTETPQPGAGQQDQGLDGRRGPQNIRNSIKAASEALPDHGQAFKELGNAYFREQAYKQHFATPQEAASAKQLIEGIGGVEGISGIQEKAAQFEAQDASFRDGNPEVLDAFFKDYPEGAAALAPHYLDRLAKTSPEVFQNAIAPHAIGMLDKAGVGNFLQAIQNEQDPSRAQAMVKQLADWYAGQRQNVQQAQQSPRINPQDDKIKQEREGIQKEREQLFNQGVEAKVTSAVTPEIGKTVDQYAKQYKWSDSQKVHFQNTLQSRVIEQMNNDATYKKQVELRRAAKSRTHDTVASYISSEFNLRLKDAAFKVAQEIYGAPRGGSQNGTGVPRAEAPKTSTNGGPLLVSQQPDKSQVDWNHKDADVWWIQNKAKMKDGRLLTWK